MKTWAVEKRSPIPVFEMRKQEEGGEGVGGKHFGLDLGSHVVRHGL